MVQDYFVKYVKTLLFAIIFFAFISVDAYAYSMDTRLVINGIDIPSYEEELKKPERNGYGFVENNEVYISLRTTSMYLCESSYDRDTGKITINDGFTEIQMSTKNKDYLVNGTSDTMSVKPIVYNDEVYVPARYIAQSLKKHFAWDGLNNIYYIGHAVNYNGEDLSKLHKLSEFHDYGFDLYVNDEFLDTIVWEIEDGDGSVTFYSKKLYKKNSSDGMVAVLDIGHDSAPYPSSNIYFDRVVDEYGAKYGVNLACTKYTEELLNKYNRGAKFDSQAAEVFSKAIIVPSKKFFPNFQLEKPQQKNISKKKGKFKFAGVLDGKRKGKVKKDKEATYYYDDKYFSKPATKYNNSLATMSLALELTSWPSHEKEKWIDPRIQEGTKDYYDDKLVNLKTLLVGNPTLNDHDYSGIGFSRFKANKVWEGYPTRESIGLASAYKIVKFNNEDTAIVTLVIRGGGYSSEWSSNAAVGLDGNHWGFDKASEDAIEFLDSYIKNEPQLRNKKLKLWIVGYSRAAATANLVSGKLGDSYTFTNGSTVNKENIYCYTFATPKGLLASGSITDGRTMNTINNNDFVPRVAPSDWGFSRYNMENDYILPSIETSNNFNNEKKSMLEHFKSLGYNDSDYIVKEGTVFSVADRLKLNQTPEGKLRFTNTMVPYIEQRYPSSKIGNETISFVANDVFKDRTNYYFMDQSWVRESLFYIFGEGNDKNLFSKLTAKENMQHSLKNAASYDMLDKPIQSSYLGKLKTREIVEKMIESAGLRDKLLYAFQPHQKLVTDLIVKLIEDANNTTDGLLKYRSVQWSIINWKSIFQAHYPEIALAWSMQNDKNYNGNVDKKFSSKTRTVKINCPVDINVYDNTGRYRGGIQNEVPDMKEESIISYIDVTGQKTLVLPADGDYSIEITAREKASVNVNIADKDLNTNSIQRLENYYDVTVEKGETLKLKLPAFSESELFDHNETPSVNYTLSNQETEIDSSEIITGPDTKNKFKLELSAEGNGGYIYGGGTFMQGEFAKINAYLLPESEFLGWYSNGTMLSKDLEYRFAVKSDMNVVAKFTNVDYYDLKINPGEGGKVNKVVAKYPAKVQSDKFIATPDEGYKFLKWESVDIEIENPENNELTFITPNKNVVINAVFEKTDSETSGQEEPGEKPGETGTSGQEEGKGSIHLGPANPTGTAVEIDKNEVKSEKIPYIFGYPDGTFRPNNNLTRAEAVSIVVRLMDIDDIQHANVFKDLPEDHWAAKEINFAYSKGILKEGMGENFRPDEKITRAELSYLLANIIPGETKDTDLTDISGNWAEESIKKLYNNGVIIGYPDKTFRPDNPITRAEFVTMINKTFDVRRDIDASNINSPFSDLKKDHWAFENIILASVEF